LGVAALIGSIAIRAVLYFAVLVVVGELGKQDADILKSALLRKVYPHKPLEASDPA
jgi:hypothetical protein